MRLGRRGFIRAGTDLRGRLYGTSAEAARERPRGRRGARRPPAHADLSVDARHVGLDRPHAEDELGRDLVVRAALSHETKHLTLAGGQRIRVGAPRRARQCEAELRELGTRPDLRAFRGLAASGGEQRFASSSRACAASHRTPLS